MRDELILDRAQLNYLYRISQDFREKEKVRKRAAILYSIYGQGLNVSQVARENDVSRPTIYKWIERVKTEDIHTILYDKERSGRPKYVHVKPYQYGHRKEITDREKEIAKWSSLGKTNWEISMILDISENTVKKHLSNIMEKTLTNNKTHAVATLMRRSEI